MKKLLLAAGILSLGFSGAFAQDLKTASPAPQATSAASPQTARKMDPKSIAQMRASRLERELSLTPEQTTKIQAIFLADNPDGVRRMSENPETEKQIKAVLTPEQATKFDEVKAKREAAMKARREQMQQQPAQ
jgi:periplasmic protein CpxP/Spy